MTLCVAGSNGTHACGPASVSSLKKLRIHCLRIGVCGLFFQRLESPHRFCAKSGDLRNERRSNQTAFSGRIHGLQCRNLRVEFPDCKSRLRGTQMYLMSQPLLRLNNWRCIPKACTAAGCTSNEQHVHTLHLKEVVISLLLLPSVQTASATPDESCRAIHHLLVIAV